MSFNSRTRNCKVMKETRNFAMKTTYKTLNNFEIRPSVLIHMQKKFIIGPPLIRRFSLYESLLV
ncbi:unnamed protein product [Triticum turgidum subsp. durum]|uniref:Uncharacterized protein n=1 Tax=Triticum turgidum subsp. durum TaxID=4567 RepID=A0A9R0S9N6_TRITD|nr:unnamed protein product [Triticum turgidum subsp. durum]